MNTRPRVIVHILQSIDGRVAGSFFSSAYDLIDEYGAIRHELDGDCVIYGATTARQLLACGHFDRSRFAHDRVPGGDYVAETDGFMFVILDPNGTLGFESAHATRGDMEGHIVQLLRADVDKAYLSYLRSIGVSYILAGIGAFDVKMALRKLNHLFGRKRALLMGGGYANGTFAAADCVDELSIVIAPDAEVASGQPALFETMPGLTAKPLSFDLSEVRQLPHSGVWLHYTR